MAGADELVLGAVPRHDAAEVSAHGVDPVGGQRLVLLHHQVRGVSGSPCKQARGGGAHKHAAAVSINTTQQACLPAAAGDDDGDG